MDAAGVRALSRVLSPAAEMARDRDLASELARDRDLAAEMARDRDLAAEMARDRPPALRVLCLGGLYDGDHLHNPRLGPHCAAALQALVAGAAGLQRRHLTLTLTLTLTLNLTLTLPLTLTLTLPLPLTLTRPAAAASARISAGRRGLCAGTQRWHALSPLISPLYLPCISLVSPLHLAYISRCSAASAARPSSQPAGYG